MFNSHHLISEAPRWRTDTLIVPKNRRFNETICSPIGLQQLASASFWPLFRSATELTASEFRYNRRVETRNVNFCDTTTYEIQRSNCYSPSSSHHLRLTAAAVKFDLIALNKRLSNQLLIHDSGLIDFCRRPVNVSLNGCLLKSWSNPVWQAVPYRYKSITARILPKIIAPVRFY